MKFSDNKTSQGNLEDEGLDFSEIKQQILRNKKLVYLVIFGSFCLGLLYSFTREEIWRGKFQIVLSNLSNKHFLKKLTKFWSNYLTLLILRPCSF